MCVYMYIYDIYGNMYDSASTVPLNRSSTALIPCLYRSSNIRYKYILYMFSMMFIYLLISATCLLWV